MSVLGKIALVFVMILGFAGGPAFAQSNTPETTWVTNGDVFASARSGDVLYLGGSFTSIGPVGGTSVARTNLAAIDLRTGAATDWRADTNGSVFSLAVGGGIVYAGGSFSTVGGLLRGNVAAVRADTGATLTTWVASADQAVNKLVLAGDQLYVGGAFTTIGGESRARLARVSAASGFVTGWAPAVTGGDVAGIAVEGDSVYAGGDFSSVGAVTRANLAEISATTGLATAWDPRVSGGPVLALSRAGDTVFAAGLFTSAGGASRVKLAGLSASTGEATGFAPAPAGGGGAPVTSVFATADTVYVSGFFSTIGGKARPFLAGLRPADGTATDWTPAPDGGAYDVAVHGDRVVAGGEFTTMGGRPSRGFGVFALPQPVAPPPPPPPPAVCVNGIDDDGDGLSDARDPQCGRRGVESPRDPELLACLGRRLVLTDVRLYGTRLEVRGVADPVLAGRPVSILVSGRRYASAIVQGDGSFLRNVSAPRSTRARLQATIDGQRSTAFRLGRRAVQTDVRLVDGLAEVSGRVTGKVKGATVRLYERGNGCRGAFTRIRSFVLGAEGRFSVRVPPPEGARTAVYRARIQLPNGGGTTFTFPRALTLP